MQLSRTAWLILAVLFVVGSVQSQKQRKKKAKAEPMFNEVLKGTEDGTGNDQTEEDVLIDPELLMRQIRMQMFYTEEQTRSNGDSGLKQIRVNHDGTKPYFSESHAGRSVAAIHDHANNIRTVGMGELIAVLNGVEFRTRHNDYRLMMPSKSSSDYHATEPIQLPDVPPEVLGAGSVTEQATEMREWFKAWQSQDPSVRDYTKYFKPVLCYLEGAWTSSNPNKLDESFDSDRHHIDADSWLDLQEKILFTSYSGSKDNLENYAYLPTTLFNVSGNMILAQWNYRILCHPLNRDLPLNRLRVVDDLAVRMANGLNMDKLKYSRAARFQVNPDDSDVFRDKQHKKALLDELMGQIPGKNNYGANLTDDAFGLESFSLDGKTLNAGFYHRWYKVQAKDASGLQVRHRGFSDMKLFMSGTTQEKVVPIEVEKCPKNRRLRKIQGCTTFSQRWTYAIPLEIIYLTPLSNWNPFDLPYRGEANSKDGKSILLGPNGGRRNGQCTNDIKAFNGTNSKTYYITPEEFYTSRATGSDAADTTRKSAVCVLDSSGRAQRVKASGTRIFFPPIKDIGVLRQRYPIMPLHGEGGAVWKELSALREIVLHPQTYRHMMPDDTESEASDGVTRMQVTAGRANHVHDVVLSSAQMDVLRGGQTLHVDSDQSNGHSHSLELIGGSNFGVECPIIIRRCDGANRCRDGHGKRLCLVQTMA